MSGNSLLGIGHIVLTKSRASIVKFTRLIYNLDVRLATAKPKPLKPYLNMWRPFPQEIWLSVLATLCLAFAAFYLMFLASGASQEEATKGLLGILGLLVKRGNLR